MSRVDRRVTATQPTCPSWCTRSAAFHEEEAHDDFSSWYSHRVDTVNEPDIALVTLSRLQIFDEELDPGEESSTPDAIFVETYRDDISLEHAEIVAQALLEAVRLGQS